MLARVPAVGIGRGGEASIRLRCVDRADLQRAGRGRHGHGEPLPGAHGAALAHHGPGDGDRPLAQRDAELLRHRIPVGLEARPDHVDLERPDPHRPPGPIAVHDREIQGPALQGDLRPVRVHRGDPGAPAGREAEHRAVREPDGQLGPGRRGDPRADDTRPRGPELEAHRLARAHDEHEHGEEQRRRQRGDDADRERPPRGWRSGSRDSRARPRARSSCASGA